MISIYPTTTLIPPELRHAQPSLQEQHEDRVIATPEPGRLIGGGEERFLLSTGQRRDELALELLRRDREDALASRAVRGLLERDETKERMDRGESRIARPHAVTSLLLEMLEKRCDERGVEIGQQQGRGRLVQAVLYEREQ
jgi:hypothetical protein